MHKCWRYVDIARLFTIEFGLGSVVVVFMIITLINRSKWPTPLLEVLAGFIIPNALISWEYKIVVRDTSKTKSWRGLGTRDTQWIQLHRRYRPEGGWPEKFKDPRYRFSRTFEFNS